jgi:hypothetical protein
MLLADFCNRHGARAPVYRSTPERHAFACTDRACAPLRSLVFAVDLNAFANAAPSCLAAARPRVGKRLTALAELQLRCSQPTPISGQDRTPLPGGAPAVAVFSTASRVGSGRF